MAELDEAISKAQELAEQMLEEAQAKLEASERTLVEDKANRLKIIEQARSVLNDEDIAHILGISTRSLGALFRSPRAAGAPEDVDVVDGRTGEVIWDKVTTVKQNVTATNAQAEGVGSEA